MLPVYQVFLAKNESSERPERKWSRMIEANDLLEELKDIAFPELCPAEYLERFHRFEKCARDKLKELASKSEASNSAEWPYDWSTQQNEREKENQVRWNRFWQTVARSENPWSRLIGFGAWRCHSQLCGVHALPLRLKPDFATINRSYFSEANPFRFLFSISAGETVLECGELGSMRDCEFVSLDGRYKAKLGIAGTKVTIYFPGLRKRAKRGQKTTVRKLPPASDGAVRVELVLDSTRLYLIKFSTLPLIELFGDFARFQPSVPPRAMLSWQNGDISNFEYLLSVNTALGRSFRDPNAYPIMPSVVSDFDTSHCCWTQASFYRDFSQASYPARAYLFYLSRIEPYRSLALKNSYSTGSPFVSIRDCANYELIPEFFFFPDFLVDVTLPNWADSPVDFVYKNRQALESHYVSAHLHLWINAVLPRLPHQQRSSSPIRTITLSRLGLPKLTRAVTFSGSSVWVLGEFDSLSSADLRAKLPQFQFADVPKHRTSTNCIRLHASSRSMIVCLYETQGSRLHIYSYGRDPTIVLHRTKITQIHCDFSIIAYADIDSLVTVDDIRLRQKWSIPVPVPFVTALYVSSLFHTVLCGCERTLHLYSLTSHSPLRSITWDSGTPVKLLITPAWGFIVVCTEELHKDGSLFWMLVYSINGFFIRRVKLEMKIVAWVAWKSRLGFDYLAFADSRNQVFVVEVYYCDSMRAIFDVGHPVSALYFWMENETIVAACDCGKLEFMACTAMTTCVESSH
jgi:hypothetical protein